MKNSINQTTKWGQQSYRFAKASAKTDFYKHNLIKKRLIFFKNKRIKNMLDVGCANGDFLNDFLKNKIIKKYGIETTQATVDLCKKRHKKINFIKAFAHNLPFEDNKFDLVSIWSVLHWIDRNYYLQSLGELIRITNKYLMVMDFFPKTDHKTKYKHKKGFFTFKTDFDKILSNSKILKKRFVLNFYIDEKKRRLINTFKKSQDNIIQRKLVIYEKKNLLPYLDYKVPKYKAPN